MTSGTTKRVALVSGEASTDEIRPSAAVVVAEAACTAAFNNLCPRNFARRYGERQISLL
jgi:hypothetical protein